MDNAEENLVTLMGKATDFLSNATEKLEKAVEVAQQLWTVVSPFVELAYTLNKVGLTLASITFKNLFS